MCAPCPTTIASTEYQTWVRPRDEAVRLPAVSAPAQRRLHPEALTREPAGNTVHERQ